MSATLMRSRQSSPRAGQRSSSRVRRRRCATAAAHVGEHDDGSAVMA